MSPRKKLLVACGVSGVGLLAMVVALVTAGGIRDYLDGHYARSSTAGSSVVYTSTSKPNVVYSQIRSARPPADTEFDPSGYFLRYSDDIVAITANGTGSRIYLDDERHGYARWLPYVGGTWGTGGGAGESFRGGGPGSGK